MNLSAGSINTRENNLNLIRLLAATSVTFGHSFAMTHGSHYDLLFSVSSAAFGFYAVAIFFTLSGFLITQSYIRKPEWKKFLKARLLRLVPGYLFANFITALLIVFIVKSDALLMFTRQFLFHIIGGSFKEKYSFPDTFAHLHYNSTNGSLWTLPYEFQMYLIVMLLGLTTVLYKRKAVAGIFAVLFIIAVTRFDILYNIIFPILFRIKNYEGTYLALPFCFGLGILAFLYKENFKLSLPAASALLITTFFMDGWFLKILAWSYFVFCFGYIPKFYLPKLNFKNDISYGIYILSWPVQQCVLHLKVTDNPIMLFFVSMLFIVPFSIVSWKLVEEPSLKFKR
jgi:peptidoglycan/LPS O-acetylase OafA/YrhL